MLGPVVPQILQPTPNLQSRVRDCLSHVFLCSNCFHLHVIDERTRDQRSSERKSNLTKDTQLVSGRPGIWTQDYLLPKLCYSTVAVFFPVAWYINSLQWPVSSVKATWSLVLHFPPYLNCVCSSFLLRNHVNIHNFKMTPGLIKREQKKQADHERVKAYG